MMECRISKADVIDKFHKLVIAKHVNATDM